ncbi:KilA-N domain-containing protein [Pseudomonas aeruginosa]
MSKQLTVCGVAIKQDAEGRYCLNDLHKAAGGEERHATWRFLRLDTTEELTKEIQTPFLVD